MLSLSSSLCCNLFLCTPGSQLGDDSFVLLKMHNIRCNFCLKKSESFFLFFFFLELLPTRLPPISLSFTLRISTANEGCETPVESWECTATGNPHYNCCCFNRRCTNDYKPEVTHTFVRAGSILKTFWAVFWKKVVGSKQRLSIFCICGFAYTGMIFI